MSSRRARVSVLSAAVIACLGLATFQASAARSNDANSIAKSYLQQNAHRFGLTGADTREATVSNVVPGTARGMSHVYVQQRYRGIPVWNAILTLNVRADGSVINPGSRFIGNLTAKAGDQSARKAPGDAAQAAANFLDLKVKQPFRVLGKKGGASQRHSLSDGGISTKPIDAELVWYFAEDMGKLRLAWKLEIEKVGGGNWWYAFVDAGTNEPLGAQDLIVRDSADSIAASIGHLTTGSLASTIALTGASASAAFASIDGSSYTVFPLPYESPTDGARAAVSGAADPGASPYGWHDTDGAAGAEYTVTRGNNVHAYTDLNADNVADAGSDPDGSASLTFNFPLLASDQPSAYRPAAVTNLFYWNNIIHDITHNYGFNEASGNFQVNNYGNGGLGADDVRAEAQDGSGTNNANFGTPVDGSRPRMQMFVWAHPYPNFVTLTSPGGIAGDYPATGAVFGPTPATTGPISGSIEVATDGDTTGGTTNDACQSLVGFTAGNIALVERGLCGFVVKVKNAQIAGATAVIVANNSAAAPPTMGGTDASIVIPSVAVFQSTGNLIKANVPVSGSVRANPLTSISRDSDLDAGVIAHEYGHGISNRLTGGPATVSCLQNEEQMGEGWSDWFGITMTTRGSDIDSTRRGVGSYLLFEPADGAGIRPTPYSTDMAINPSTYAWVANPAISRPHGIGYVWNTMLWEVYWNLVHKKGYNADLYDGWNSGGNNMAFQLVMDGMKMQTCSPGFVDGRDAILAADTALTGGANQCEIWRGFAKRGLGFSASQGSSANRSDGVEAFDLPAMCTSAVFAGFAPPILPAPALLTLKPGSVVPVKFSLTGVAGPIELDTQPVNCSTLEPTGAAPIGLNSSLGLVQSGDTYQIDWKTSKNWGGTCRAVTLRIPAPSDPVAYFRFK